MRTLIAVLILALPLALACVGAHAFPVAVMGLMALLAVAMLMEPRPPRPARRPDPSEPEEPVILQFPLHVNDRSW